jgi:hypothetical protein
MIWTKGSCFCSSVRAQVSEAHLPSSQVCPMSSTQASKLEPAQQLLRAHVFLAGQPSKGNGATAGGSTAAQSSLKTLSDTERPASTLYVSPNSRWKRGRSPQPPQPCTTAPVAVV